MFLRAVSVDQTPDGKESRCLGHGTFLASPSMTSQLLALCFDANDPLGLARFWAGVLGWS